jgi:hypothetical protein
MYKSLKNVPNKNCVDKLWAAGVIYIKIMLINYVKKNIWKTYVANYAKKSCVHKFFEKYVYKLRP